MNNSNLVNEMVFGFVFGIALLLIGIYLFKIDETKIKNSLKSLPVVLKSNKLNPWIKVIKSYCMLLGFFVFIPAIVIILMTALALIKIFFGS